MDAGALSLDQPCHTAKDDGDLDKRIGETISIIGHF